MSFVAREQERIHAALLRSSGAEYDRLYAAQQALAWATDPGCYRSPFDSIMGIQAEPGGCPADSRLNEQSDRTEASNPAPEKRPSGDFAIARSKLEAMKAEIGYQQTGVMDLLEPEKSWIDPSQLRT